MDFGENKVKKCGGGDWENAVTVLNIFQQSLVLYITFPRDCCKKTIDRGNI
jgi:hypothetical protein